jgi:DMSO/TMAO reductase YedYZ molybdopterin-dependent catalytic subunit
MNMSHSANGSGARSVTRRDFLAALVASGAALAVGSLTSSPRPATAAPLADDVLNRAGRPPGQLAPSITPTAAFYIVSKNGAGDPRLDSGRWRLVLDGAVNRPVQLDYPTLQRLPAVELVKTLECISNLTASCELTSFGCDLISTASWRGARLVDLLDLAGGLKPDAVSLAVLAADEFSSALPLEVALDEETLLVYEMNGAPLPPEHGAPARLLAPGRYGFKSAKWVVRLSPQTADYVDWYSQRGWNRQGLVRTMSRIDTPANGALLPAGPQTIAGIAYAGARGISAVELSADGGTTWQPTSFLENQPGRDSWVRWQGSFTIASGQELLLVSRATDGDGVLQEQQFSLAEPDGAAGWPSLSVRGA